MIESKNKLNDELVVLVDDQDNQIGTAIKAEVHTAETPLHRAFSVYLFDEDGKILATQRADEKITWPGVWSNSFCGHPAPGENREEAIKRRIGEELGCGILDLEKVSDYRYRFERNGIVENEICPVYMGKIDGDLSPNPKEVQAWGWFEWSDFLDELKLDDENKWSEWAKEEAILVDEYMQKIDRDKKLDQR